MSLMKKLNNFFFPLEDGKELHLSDGIWFYGFILGWVVLTIIVLL